LLDAEENAVVDLNNIAPLQASSWG